jgi:uncharacterized protein (TIGR00730 family)
MLDQGDPEIKRICIFCGSNAGARPEYRTAAETVGRLLAERHIGMVYGGGTVGLMGVTADACLASGGEVLGVIPRALVGREVQGRNVEHNGVTRLEIVDSMHARKARMAELADGFIALPGGFGTFEELFEVLTWAQLGFHRKPIGLLDVAGYYGPLIGLCDRALAEGFLRPDSRKLLLSDTDPGTLLLKLAEYRPILTPVWIKADKEL